jgi:hypothetical protein
MARQGYDLELRRYNGRGWRAMFFPSGFEHSLTSHAGAAWARSPWEAVQRAAGDALHKLEAGEPPPRAGTSQPALPFDAVCLRRASTSRTLRARASGVKGFCRNTVPGSNTPW